MSVVLSWGTLSRIRVVGVAHLAQSKTKRLDDDDWTGTLRMVVRITKQRTTGAWVKRRAVEAAGLLLLLVGVAALFLPAPGLLTIAAGLAVLSTQYVWAERLLHPLKARAYRLAAEGVRSWPRVAFGAISALVMVAIGILWGIGLSVPHWWPVADNLWLVGGWATGVTIIASGSLALALITYSYMRFRPSLALVPGGVVTPLRSRGR